MSQRIIAGWADRLPTGVRLLCLLVASTLALSVLAFAVGFTVAVLEQGGFGPRSSAILGGALLGISVLAFLSWQLSAHWRRPGRSSFDRRYTRMWVILLGLALPVGLFLGAISDRPGAGAGELFSNGPIDAGLALIAAGLLLVVFVVTMVLYHRTIDDHEERAYLWASTGGFYFLAAVLPTVWLLERGGLAGPFELGAAMLLLLASIAVQCLIWAWLKFR